MGNHCHSPAVGLGPGAVVVLRTMNVVFFKTCPEVSGQRVFSTIEKVIFDAHLPHETFFYAHVYG